MRLTETPSNQYLLLANEITLIPKRMNNADTRILDQPYDATSTFTYIKNQQDISINEFSILLKSTTSPTSSLHW